MTRAPRQNAKLERAWQARSKKYHIALGRFAVRWRKVNEDSKGQLIRDLFRVTMALSKMIETEMLLDQHGRKW